MASIDLVRAREILDSRGNPTVEVEIGLSNGVYSRAAVPSGASTGEHEAVELRDGGKRYAGKGVLKAVEAVLDVIAPAIIGLEASEQRFIDQTLIDLDGTPSKSKLGANAILGVSLAVARAAAESAELPLFKYLGGPNSYLLPVPMMNIINGGAHADNSVDIQEFMIAPLGAENFKESLRWGAEVYHSLKSVLKSKGKSTGLGDEGGFAPDLSGTVEVLDIISSSIENAGFKFGTDVAFALDVASSEFYDKEKGYHYEGKYINSDELSNVYASLIKEFPLLSIEDPFAEDDWDAWVKFTENFGDKVQIVGDDLFVTNPARIAEGINKGAANALLVKVNQIGTLTETFDAVSLAHNNGYKTMMSHRSGETEDTFISDLAVAVGSGQIKSGAPARSERVAKYNQLLRIEEELGDAARFAGETAFPLFRA